jgi:hypothetical protein
MNSAEDLDAEGVPRPDGTVLGDVIHVLSVHRGYPDDYLVLRATSNVYGPDDVTGMSMGDLRGLLALAILGQRVRVAYDEAAAELGLLE